MVPNVHITWINVRYTYDMEMKQIWKSNGKHTQVANFPICLYTKLVLSNTTTCLNIHSVRLGFISAILWCQY